MSINELERLKAVKRFDHFDFNLNKGLEDILTLAADICETPVAFITLVDDKSQWFKVCKGLEVFEMPKEVSFCQYTIMESEVMVVPDPTLDDRFKDIPLVAEAPHIRFYAGAPLATDNGQNVGTLCVFDGKSKNLSDEKKNLLGILAKQAIHLMELEVCLMEIQQKNKQIEKQTNALIEIAFTQAHEFRGPLSTIMGFMNIIKDDEYESPKEHLMLMEHAVNKLDEKILLVVKSTQMVKELYEA